MNAEKIFAELTAKLRHFFVTANAQEAVVALSGGIDSALVVALAVEALGAERVRVVMLPSPFSSDHSVDDSIEMAEKLGLKYDIIKIDSLYNDALQKIERVLPEHDLSLASENLQSRLRCVLTMAISNTTGALMLNTSNRSEILVGYGTLYGDTSGAVGVIASLYKTEVYELSRYINSVRGGWIPQNIIDKAPSAELRHGQTDNESLPEYDVLDPILRLMVDEYQSAGQIAQRYDAQTVARVEKLYKSSAFKRLQLPPVL